MSIIETMNKVNEFLLAKVQIVFPGLQMQEFMFYIVVAAAVGALLLALYGMIAHPHSRADIDDARARGYSRGKEQAEKATILALGNKAQEIEELKRRLATSQSETKQAVQMLQNVRTESGDLYRKERIIASLAVDLDGYEEIADKAERLVDTLN